MRRLLGAVVVMGIIGVWNLAGQWMLRRGAAHDPTPPTITHADSVRPFAAEKAFTPAPRGKIDTPPSLPGSFRTDPLVFLSTAPPESLDLLPGVGPVLAARIIDARRERGRFTSWDDVLAVKGIGPRTVARWQSHRTGQ